MQRASLISILGLTLATAVMYSDAVVFSQGQTEIRQETHSRANTTVLKTSRNIAASLSHQETKTAVTEGCITCHGQIEPMHKYGSTGALDTLNDGKDAVNLTCTNCHGGNPA